MSVPSDEEYWNLYYDDIGIEPGMASHLVEWSKRHKEIPKLNYGSSKRIFNKFQGRGRITSNTTQPVKVNQEDLDNPYLDKEVLPTSETSETNQNESQTKDNDEEILQSISTESEPPKMNDEEENNVVYQEPSEQEIQNEEPEEEEFIPQTLPPPPNETNDEETYPIDDQQSVTKLPPPPPDLPNDDEQIPQENINDEYEQKSPPPLPPTNPNQPTVGDNNDSIEFSNNTYFAKNSTEGIVKFEKANAENSVYILKCSNTGLIVPNKVKSVTIDNCNSCQIEINDVITSLDIINCKKVKVFLNGILQTINIDNTTEPNLVISQNTLNQNPKILTSMVSDFNIEVPKDDKDTMDLFVPYQFETIINPDDLTVQTIPVEHCS